MSENSVRPLEYYENLDEIELGRGNVISTLDLAAYPGDYPVYSSSAVGAGEFGRYGRFMFDEELITWSIDGGGRPFYRPKHRYSVTNVCGYLRVKRPDLWNYRFLHALLEKLQSGIQFDYQMKAHPSVIRELYRFARVPLKAQETIGLILDTLDTTLQQTEALISKLKAVKQGLLHDLLTRGIDANGELRPPQVEAPHLYKSSPLGWIPKEWDVVTLKAMSKTVTSGSRDWARFYADSGALFVRIGNLTREHINFRYESTMYVRPPRNADGQRTRLESGDILISITADLGIVGVVPDGLGEAYINQHIALVRPDLEAVNSRFVGHYLAGPIAQTYISKLNDAGAKAGLNLPTIRGLVTAKPLRAEQDLIAARLDEIDNRIQNATAEAAKLCELKSGLMDDLLTGRVRVTPLLETAAP